MGNWGPGFFGGYFGGGVPGQGGFGGPGRGGDSDSGGRGQGETVVVWVSALQTGFWLTFTFS